LSGRDLLRQANLARSDIDLVAGGPPCKGFSSANLKTRNGNNPHNRLVDQFFRIVAEIRPKLFLMENVMGLIWFADEFLRNGTYFSKLESLGYETQFIRINALDYGVPQNRQRLFIVGKRVKREFHQPEPTYGERPLLPFVTLGEAIIGDLPPIKEGIGVEICGYVSSPRSPYQQSIRSRAKKVHNHVITRNSETVRLRMSKVPVGGNWRDVPPEFLHIRVSHSCLYKRLDPAKPSVTLGNFRKNMLIHPYEDRHLSLREAARLQSFPDDYYFDGPISHMQQQIADATPPLLTEAVGRQLARMLEK
jgi:DNA (cytosine-5)-methyltransferase 1